MDIKTTTGTVLDILSRLRKRFQPTDRKNNMGAEEPIRATLYSSGQLNNHGKTIAATHRLLRHKVPDQLLKRLDDNERKLLEVRNALVESIRAGKTIPPAAEWLLDNFYLIEEQFILARKHLPKGYSEGLPGLADGLSAGMPRVYDIVLEIIAHSDGRVDVQNLTGFVAAYQGVAQLTLGELWAIPIMLRLAVLENLRRVCSKITLDIIDHELADYWAEKMMDTVKNDPGNLILVIADMVRSKPVLEGPFVSGLVRRLQGHGQALALPLSWMEDQLSVLGLSSNELVSQEGQRQAADQVSVRNSIGTLRFLGANDWTEFVETLSSVEQVLRKDGTGTYPLMDFATRDQYRHVVEKIAKYSTLSETEVAEKVLDLAAAGQKKAPLDRKAHVGYYLLDKGLVQTQQVVQMRFTLRERLARLTAKAPVLLYLSAIFLLTAVFAGGMLYWTFRNGTPGKLLTILVPALFISGAMQLAVALVNWIATLLVKPGLLPRMDFSKGIPPECRSLVVIPTIISSKAYIEELTEALEIRFLANREENLHYGLLTDFADSLTEHAPGDEELIALAKGSIEALNEKYSRSKKDIFFLFHRPRTWNAKERRWMGYERKRGKLAALNTLLSGTAGPTVFSVICGEQYPLSQIRYVITLDSDTQLPREAAWKFIATMAHPLNRAVYDQKLRRVTEGYGILQPRIAAALPRSAASLYLRMQGNAAGIDPYTQVSSDVYQDVFGEGSFIGKGIYDIDVFRQATEGVFPENRILSHDLLEGCYARSGLLSDVLLYEDNPAQYAADIKRRHRWIRGDWQIGAWMMPWVTLANGKLATNKLSALSRWKIMDNLRRSLLPISLLSLLLLGWTILPYAWFWTFMVTVIITLPVLAGAGWQLAHKPRDLNARAHLSEVGLSIRDILLRFVFGVAVLPYEAWKSMDAIVRANWRMVVSRRKLLEWTPSAAVARNSIPGAGSAYLRMWQSPLLAALCGIAMAMIHAQAIPVAAPVLLLWLLAPVIARRISLPEKEDSPGLTEAQYLFLHKTARKTWAFFEQFVTAEDHWLPPDNFQEEPTPVIAHRTSPTNMGLSLLSNLAAFDFGYISGRSLVRRTNDTLQSMRQLERYKGHFYNWYDTLTLLPLPPRYVSTVDSGNLIGHLLTLRQGLLPLPDQPVVHPDILKGIKATLDIVRDHFKKSHKEAIEKITAALSDTSATGSLTAIRECLDLISCLLEALPGQRNGQNMNGHMWLTHLLSQVQQIREDLLQTLPWIDLLPVPAMFDDLNGLDRVPTLAAIPDMVTAHLKIIAAMDQDLLPASERQWIANIRSLLPQAAGRAREQQLLLRQLEQQCEQLSTVEYDFLYDKATSLLRIGYNVDEQRKDDSYYDLLASEARLGIFAGIAQGKLPQASWFALGRLLTNTAGDPILLSWSGSMFEYLMPQLVMPSYENTLLAQTSKATVKRQIEYAAQQGIPWGISESAYNAVDAGFSYQYRAFGVPGLGLKRGLEEDLVIAPYASMLALMVLPEKACANLQLLAAKGFEGAYGFYEAIDYTANRLPRGEQHAIVRSFMVHHQGMGFLSLAYLLLNKPMQRRFSAELRFQATLLLLQEKIPRATVFYAHTAELIQKDAAASATPERRITTPNTLIPEVQLLSNGHYQVMITNSGSGYSRWKDIALTRWREDGTMDNYGAYCYIKDVEADTFWSNTHQPALVASDNYEVLFSPGHVEFRRHDQGIDTKTEIVISPEDDVEMRRIRITNRTQVTKVMEVTSYAEVVMAAQAADESHPAFSNLFVQTEILPDHKAILCTRRPRSQGETPPWMFHLMDVYGVSIEVISYETDRMQFIGRGRNLAHPGAMEEEQLSGSEGAVLDPVFAIRYRFVIKPGQTALVDMVYGAGESKEHCRNLMHKYRDQHLKKRAFELSWTHSQVLLRQINASEAEAQLYDRLAASIIFTNPVLRAAPATINSNYRGQSALWSHSISGDLPIVLLRIDDPEQIELVRQMIQAHAYWRLKGLAVDLVILNQDHGSYRQLLQEEVLGLITADTGNKADNRPGSIFVRSADQLSPEDLILFGSIAKIIIDGKSSLSEQAGRLSADKTLPAAVEWQSPVAMENETPAIALSNDLLFYNGSGGFSPDGKTYAILTTKQTPTPAPWVNVIANANFGTVVSERGSAYSWAVNAHEYRLTPWSNDPVSDIGGEAFYLRDEASGVFWSPAPFPVEGDAPYISTHGFGYSTFEHTEKGISSKLCVSVDKELPQKFIVLEVKNDSGTARQLTATGFMEMILGDVRSKTNMHILPEPGATGNALLFRNRYNTAFANQVSFFRVSGASYSFTTDRTEFIGRNRNLQNPQALSRKKLSGRIVAGRDICAALQVQFDLLPGEKKEIIFQLGSGDSDQSVKELLQQPLDHDTAVAALEAVKAYWSHLLGAVQVTTPDPALNLLANGWLLYQTISSRLLARSGFYQSGGAFGFRDQLQDVLALLHTAPSMAKDQLLLNASRQFIQGDVQHWWHPPEGRGVRTRCSDDLLWLPFVLVQYVSVTGDKDILNELVPFLEGRALHAGEDSLYDLPGTSDQASSLYEHCVRSIKLSLRFGQHGLPLMGSGDWNDGMDQVGHNGQGESVWLAFFLYKVLTGFEAVANDQGDNAFALLCKEAAFALQRNIEHTAWDGDWYLRAWFDDGTPLGSHNNAECRIDAIAQSWSVLSGAADDVRKNKAMASLDRHLVKRNMKLIALLESAFDTSDLNPGYIKGYVPGVRENGGQYSHAAIWALMAFAASGEREKAYELFSLIQPISHSADRVSRDIYKVEPYVMAADVYANESHKGRGGWTWYTGSAGWMYQFIAGSLLGLERRGDILYIRPCFPMSWPSVDVVYHCGRSVYRIAVFQVATEAPSHWEIDGVKGTGDSIQLKDDGQVHEVIMYCATRPDLATT
ncbi:GH36-type glycosyl hydrolase domain-containing protein [Taibaiella koreensis]|uniref:GH36-type glycosyl hydrolase domain-containing protein n=1 Tax=Taibaiella koreensis TaxID=1268548 RepID=UPI000E599991|nr:glucoamylase family protein [Taibaiella koreensis]